MRLLDVLYLNHRLYGSRFQHHQKYKSLVVLINGAIAADRGPMLIVNIRKESLEIKIFALAENENNKTPVLDYGADEFAVKPISPTTIVEKVSMLLMKRPAEAQTR